MASAILHGGGVAAAAALYGGDPVDWLDLSTGLNPLPPELPVLAPRIWHRLPDADLLMATRQAAAAFYGAQACLPLAVPGTQASIQHLPRLVPAGGTAAVLEPTYGEYRRVLTEAGLPVVACNGLEAIPETAGLVVVVNPNNPTGRQLPRAALLAQAARLAERGGLLVVDEAFADVAPQESLSDVAGRHPGLLVFRSFGKFFGLAGIRLGFVLGPERILHAIGDALGPWAVSGPALAVAQAVFTQPSQPIRSRILERHESLHHVLTTAGLTIAGGTALFALIELEGAAALHEHLCRRLILTRRFDYAPRWLRLGLSPDEAGDARLAVALAAWQPKPGA